LLVGNLVFNIEHLLVLPRPLLLLALSIIVPQPASTSMLSALVLLLQPFAVIMV
jgi:hypothetical protein